MKNREGPGEEFMALSIYTLPVKSDKAPTNLGLTRGITLKCLQMEGFILNCQALKLLITFYFLFLFPFFFFFNLNTFLCMFSSDNEFSD